MADEDSSRLTLAWQAAQRRLPAGWMLDGLRCASTGLSPSERSDDWIVVAVGPGGEQRAHRAGDPLGALEGLAAGFEASIAPGWTRPSVRGRAGPGPLRVSGDRPAGSAS